VIRIGAVEKLVIRVRIHASRGCEEEGLDTVRRAARESSTSEWGYRETKGG